MYYIKILYIINAILLLLHEIESAYEKEWRILKIPGAITGFLLLHIPIIFLMFYGIIEVERESKTGLILCVIFGIGGLIPFLVHKVFVKRVGHFNLLISNIIIYLNVIAGILLLVLTKLTYA